MSHRPRTLGDVIVPCPDCGTDLEELDPEREMCSPPARFRCRYCEVVFERDASGMLSEVGE